MNIRRMMACGGVLVLAMASSRVVNAQTGAEQKAAYELNQSQDVMVTRQLENLTKRLNLNTEQQVAVKLILLDDSARIKERLGTTNANINADEKRTRIKDIRSDTDNDIRKILNSEQQKRHDEQVDMKKKDGIRPNRIIKINKNS